LEAESIHIIREVAAEFQKPVMLYSIGKDSSVMVRLAQKAFYPGKIPFPLLHVDTTYKFQEMIEFRDKFCASIGARLIVHTNTKAIEEGANPFRLGTQKCCALLKTRALLDALAEGGFDAAFGGARRDEEKSRAKERVYSFRDSFGQWDPKNQRPELWNLFNSRIDKGESIRVFPLSNWTELDVWHYIAREGLEIPSIYFAHSREVFERDGILLAESQYVTRLADEAVFEARVRYRTVGDMSCTGAVESTAGTVDEVIVEIAATRITERGQTRADDRTSEAAMEDRKREGYF
jgi:sulfate adenylyltransferase subunit 2